jgi:hypothetical protein
MDRLNGMHAALPDIVWQECSASGTLLCVGMEVRAKCVDLTGTSINDATIQKVNEDDTFDIVFDDVDSAPRKNVPLDEIQIPNVSHSFSLGYLFPCVVYVVCFAHTSSSSFLIYLFFLYFLLSFLSFLFFLFSYIIYSKKVSWQKKKRMKKRVFNLF